MRGSYFEARDVDGTGDRGRGLDHGPNGSGQEPFFDDEPGQHWRVMARPGDRVDRLRRHDGFGAAPAQARAAEAEPRRAQSVDHVGERGPIADGQERLRELGREPVRRRAPAAR